MQMSYNKEKLNLKWRVYRSIATSNTGHSFGIHANVTNVDLYLCSKAILIIFVYLSFYNKKTYILLFCEF